MKFQQIMVFQTVKKFCAFYGYRNYHSEYLTRLQNTTGYEDP